MMEQPGKDEIMSAQQIKSLLAKARKGDPVHCAIALTNDKEPLLLLDRKRQPRQLAAALRERAKDAGLELSSSTLRFGRVEIDGVEDACTATFVIQKPPPGGLAQRLTVMLRKAGLGRVDIVVDDAGHDPDSAGPSEAVLAAIAKSGQVWEATLRNVERQVAGLHEQLTAAYGGHGFASELDRAFQAKVQPMLESMDASLMRNLAEIGASPDDTARDKALAAALDSIGRCARYITGEPLLASLDANPLVPLSIVQTLTASLMALRQSLGCLALRPAA